MLVFVSVLMNWLKMMFALFLRFQIRKNNEKINVSRSKKNNEKIKQQENSYFFFENEDSLSSMPWSTDDEIKRELDLFISKTYKRTKEETLAWWKDNEKDFKYLSVLAKKYLSVQASSAAVERMFSLCGDIFSNKRRRLGAKFFCDLVYFKLNEELLD